MFLGYGTYYSLSETRSKADNTSPRRLADIKPFPATTKITKIKHFATQKAARQITFPPPPFWLKVLFPKKTCSYKTISLKEMNLLIRVPNCFLHKFSCIHSCSYRNMLMQKLFLEKKKKGILAQNKSYQYPKHHIIMTVSHNSHSSMM